MGLECRLLRDSEWPAWEALLARSPDATAFHTRAWQEVCSSALGHQPLHLTAWEAGELVGLLPLHVVRPPWSRPYLVSVPAANHAGPVALRPDVVDALVGLAIARVRDEGMSHLEVRLSRDRGPLGGLRPGGNFVSYRVSLEGRAEELWTRLPKRVRASIRKARANGLEVSITRDEAALTGFYRVYQDNMDRLGSPGFGEAFFQELARWFGDRAAIVSAQHQGQTIAADFVVDGFGVASPIYSGQTRAGRALNANYLVSWETIAWGAARGFRVYDFGRSTADTPAARFKARWGATEVPLAYHYFGREGATPSVRDPQAPIFRLASHVWRRLPRSLRWWLGPRVVPYLH